MSICNAAAIVCRQFDISLERQRLAPRRPAQGPLWVDFARYVPANKRTLAVIRARWHLNVEFLAAS